MSSEYRGDLGANVTDESRTFKKAYQTVDRPSVTERDIHEEYMRDPPHNVPSTPNTDRKTAGKKEGAQQETDYKQDAPSRTTALEELATESSVHPGNPSS
ncbi:hypothetical protein K466DRAFT_573398 [Polyporus arcularius HHB13444]|uniref:Uncharacterized protein n=1 Tax=Polyporus arcularius HHB13444 TaxID=1314778 RepID=A0A5C3PRP6_9APHY|nr:hypothetical protein K466DRAFT_573398 [Polyporus arcularius HHB13444]